MVHIFLRKLRNTYVVVEGRKLRKVLNDGSATIKILPRSMLKRFGKSLEYLIPNNIMVVDFSGKSLSSDGMTALEVIFGSCRRPTIFMVVTSQATFNILLGREWIHGVGIVLSTVHQKLFFWNEDGQVEVVKADQNMYET